MTAAPWPLSYVSCEELGDRPHVMVDGAARPGSVLTLSHWPQSPTPPLLARDLSGEIVLDLLTAVRRVEACGPEAGPTGPVVGPAGPEAGSAAAAAGRRPPRRPGRGPRYDRPEDEVIAAAVGAAEGAVAVTSDHFDEDGLIALYGLVAPEAALRDRELLVEVASCGDFGVVTSDVAAQICFAIGPLAEKETAQGSGTSERFSATLPRLPELLEHPARFKSLWSEVWASLVAGRAALANGGIAIDEYPHVDLAVVRRVRPSPALDLSPPDLDRAGRRGLDRLVDTVAPPRHPVAVHSATSAGRVLAFDGDRCELHLRYESWVRVVSRRVPLRPDLAQLARQLSAKEPSGRQWEENGVGAIVARLCPAGGRTEIDPDLIVTSVCDFLESAPPAWDPFRQDGPYIPSGEQARYASPPSGPHRLPRDTGRSRGRRRS